MDKEKNIEILSNRIDILDRKIENFQKFKISSKKLEKLVFLKLKYEKELSELV